MYSSKCYNLASLVLAVMLSACAQSSPHAARWELFNKAPQSEQIKTSPQQTKIIIYRGQDAEDSNAVKGVNIYVNHHYLTTLQKNAYSEVNVCRGQIQEINAAYLDAMQRYANKDKTGVTLTPKGDLAQYLRIQLNSDNTLSTELVDEVTAKPALKNGYRQQSHALSRVPAADCAAK